VGQLEAAGLTLRVPTMSNEPTKFVAHYEGECGEAYELWNVRVPRILLPCDECDERHYFEFKYLEHRIMEWDRIEWDIDE
jgi:hypothetical protein